MTWKQTIPKYLLVHPSQHSGVADVRHIDEDIVGRVAVQWCSQPLLIQVVSNETDTPSKNEQAIESSDLNVLIGFFRSECTRVTEQVDEADGNAAVNIQDECILLRGCDLLNSEGIIQKTVAGEVLRHVLLDELDAQIRVVYALYLVANTADEFVCFS